MSDLTFLVSRLSFLLRWACLTGLAIAAMGQQEIAEGNPRTNLPTLSLNGRGYYATVKSGLAESNDTGLLYSYSLRVFAGQDKNVAVDIEASSGSIDFALNNSTKSLSDLIFQFRYFISYFYAGGFGGTTEISVSRTDGSSLDLIARTYGGSTGILFEITRGVTAEGDFRYSIISDLKEASQQDVTLGSKIEGKATLIFDITRRLIDLEAGFLYLSQPATFSGQGNGETTTAPFLGLSLSSFF